MDYLSFDLRLSDWLATSRTGVAEVLHSPVGEGDRYPFRLDLDIAKVVACTRRSTAEALDLGRTLARSVLAPAFTQWYESYQVARERSRGLRLRLHIDSWDLTRLPWELLYDGRRREFLVFDPLVSLVRYLRLHAPPPTIRQGRSLRVLAVSACPRDQMPLDWERELRMLEDALTELTEAGQVEIIPCPHATYDRLHTALMESAPDVVHYIGHGHYDQERALGMLLLEDGEGRSAALGAPEAARMLRRYGVNLVVLNACDSAQGTWAGLAPSLVRAEIPAVVAMQWPVEDQAAIRFSHAFYRALFRGRTIDECVCEARVGASGSGADPNDWAAPVLFLRSVSGRLWVSDTAGELERGATGDARRPSRRASALSDGPHFRTRGPLQSAADGDYLVDRPALRRALRLAQQPSVTQYIAILSARQTGKTTLLLRLIELLQPVATCVFIDLSVLRAQNAQACFRFVAFRLVSEFRAVVGNAALGITARLPEAPPIESSVDFLEFLRQLAEAVPMPRIILLLDEVGALTPEASDSFFNTVRTVFTQGRGLNSHLSKYLFVFSGAVDLYALTFGTNSPLNICEKIYLTDFAAEDVQAIVEQFTRLGVAVPEEAPRAIYALGSGHPYLTMRLCALLDEAGLRVLTHEAIEAAAEQMLVEDDNIHHVIHELERRPIERRRLRSILLEGRQMPFSRNDPVLASLEMIGVIRPTQPCQVRNRLYEHALRRYFRAGEGDAEATEERPALMPAEIEQVEDPDALYGRLQSLRQAALDPRGAYRPGREWEAFAAGLFATVPAFSVYPDLHGDTGELDVALAINRDAPGGNHWAVYQPVILVEQLHLDEASPERAVARLAAKAARHRARLLLVLATGGGEEAAARCAALSGAREGMCVVCLPDTAIVRLLEERGSLDMMLRATVREARMRRV
jgi:hypothetical protein